MCALVGVSQWVYWFTYLGHVALPVVWMKDPILHLTPVEVGMIMGAIVFANAIISVPSGMVMDRWGIRKTVALWTIGMGIACFLRGMSTSFWMLLAFTFLQGAFFSVDYYATVLGKWFPPEELGKAFGIYGSIFGTGAAFGPALTFPLMKWLGISWREVMYIWGVMAIVTGIIWWIFAREPVALGSKTLSNGGQSIWQKENWYGWLTKFLVRRINTQRKCNASSMNSTEVIGIPLRESILVCLRSTQLWCVSIFRCIAGLARYIYGSWLITLLIYRGLPPVEAGLVRLIGTPFGLVGWPAWGALSDKVRRRKPFIVIGALTIALAYYLSGFHLGIPLYIGLALEALAFPCYYPRLLALPAEIEDVGPRYMGTATGLNSLFDQIGAAAGPVIGGYCIAALGELPGMEVAFYVAIALFVFVAIFGLLFLKEPPYRPRARR
ncbi:MAG: MFS transporter [Candidatus Freyarchaeota archaeon]